MEPMQENNLESKEGKITFDQSIPPQNNNNTSTNTNNNSNNENTYDRKSSKKKPPFVLGGRFFLLNWLYLWAFPLIHRCRSQKNIKKILLTLANVLSAKQNGEDLDAKWTQEKANAAAEN
ncbi:hypothetical protein BGZ93_008385, partial [Podila epicladia]